MLIINNHVPIGIALFLWRERISLKFCIIIAHPFSESLSSFWMRMGIITGKTEVQRVSNVPKQKVIPDAARYISRTKQTSKPESHSSKARGHEDSPWGVFPGPFHSELPQSLPASPGWSLHKHWLVSRLYRVKQLHL